MKMNRNRADLSANLAALARREQFRPALADEIGAADIERAARRFRAKERQALAAAVEQRLDGDLGELFEDHFRQALERSFAASSGGSQRTRDAFAGAFE